MKTYRLKNTPERHEGNKKCNLVKLTTKQIGVVLLVYKIAKQMEEFLTLYIITFYIDWLTFYLQILAK